MPPRREYRRPPTSNFTYVSSCVKYLIFVLNFVFWLFGGLLIGIGLYAFVDKWQLTGLVKLENVYDVILNVSLVMVLMGGIVFIVSFAGCVGALRENTCLLKFYSLCLLIFFLLEMGIAIMGFVFPHSMQSMLEENFTDKIIHTYRDDPDLQNFIDFAQQEFRCCGLSNDGYQDWSKNEYFNCTSPSVEHCGVPFSCCINATDISSGLVNIMCGYGVQTLSVAEASKKVWTSGCIEIVRSWAERNLYTIAGIALGIALSQLFVIYLAKTLEGQIDLQKSSLNEIMEKIIKFFSLNDRKRKSSCGRNGEPEIIGGVVRDKKLDEGNDIPPRLDRKMSYTKSGRLKEKKTNKLSASEYFASNKPSENDDIDDDVFDKSAETIDGDEIVRELHQIVRTEQAT